MSTTAYGAKAAIHQGLKQRRDVTWALIFPPCCIWRHHLLLLALLTWAVIFQQENAIHLFTELKRCAPITPAEGKGRGVMGGPHSKSLVMWPDEKGCIAGPGLICLCFVFLWLSIWIILLYVDPSLFWPLHPWDVLACWNSHHTALLPPNHHSSTSLKPLWGTVRPMYGQIQYMHVHNAAVYTFRNCSIILNCFNIILMVPLTCKRPEGPT